MPTLLMSHFLPPRTGKNKFLLFKPPSLWHSCSLPRRLVSSSVFACRPHPLKTTQENPPSPPAQGPDPRRNETITARHPPREGSAPQQDKGGLWGSALGLGPHPEEPARVGLPGTLDSASGDSGGAAPGWSGAGRGQVASPQAALTDGEGAGLFLSDSAVLQQQGSDGLGADRGMGAGTGNLPPPRPRLHTPPSNCGRPPPTPDPDPDPDPNPAPALPSALPPPRPSGSRRGS